MQQGFDYDCKLNQQLRGKKMFKAGQEMIAFDSKQP